LETIGASKGGPLPKQHISAEDTTDLTLEIAHLLFIDVVGYSKLLVNEQIELMQQLNRIVRGTECFREAEASGKLIRLPTGDGMVLLFFRSPEQPVRCALEISQALLSQTHIQVRMGIHSGPVNQVVDVNDQMNIAGAGINVGQRVMDCGDAGHILLSKHVADDLTHYRHWQPYLHDLGECDVKHGLRLHVCNLYRDGLGNPTVPEKLKRGKRWKKAGVSIQPISAARWRKFVLIAALLLSAVALPIGFSILSRRGAVIQTISPATLVPEKSIAVLPFENLSEEKTNAFFADGVQDEILTDLAKIADLKVISRTSVMQYKNTSSRNLPEIAQALKVAYVLEGSVQRSANRVRVSAQLINARNDTHVWAEKYDRDLADVFAIQSEIAEKIADQLQAKLSPTEKSAISERPTSDMVAYDLYLRAKELIYDVVNARDRENYFKAVQLLDQAVARDPTFVLAYCQLAYAHDHIYWQGYDHTETRLALAETSVRAAVRLQPDSGETHLAQAIHFYRGYRNYDRAREELAKAERVLPNNAQIFAYLGYIDRRQGRWEEAIRHLEHAVNLDPQNQDTLSGLEETYLALRRYEETIAVAYRALALQPRNALLRVFPAEIEVEADANLAPLRATLNTIESEDPASAAEVAYTSFQTALRERDPAGGARALANIPSEGYTIKEADYPVPHAWHEGLLAKLRQDAPAAHAAFMAVRAETEKLVRAQPGNAKPLSMLALIDAELGDKEKAIREGRNACDMLPVSKDAVGGPPLITNLARVYALTGEKNLALEQLDTVSKLPYGPSYGALRLDPEWDPLRGDPRFEKIVASLAPKKG
jgi:TolB-like protein/class 3 adenylate cyclase/Flp pilus assembly protein TadD